MTTSIETLRSPFPDTATPQVSYGLPFTETCLKHVNETFKASRVYLIASASLTKNTNHTFNLQAALGDKLAKTRVGMTSHTLLSEILETVHECRAVDADCIITLGAGSLSDAAKAVSFGLANHVHTVEDFLRLPHTGNAETRALPGLPSKIPVICIPTSLSGGEYTAYAGVTIDSNHEKTQFMPPLAAPSLVILDGDLATATPLSIWLQSGVRAIDHCVETLCSLKSTPEVDAFAIAGLQALIPGLLKSKDDEKDAEARHACQLGVIHALFPIHYMVLPGASHGIGHMLGPLGKIGHGETSCILLPSVCKYNAKYGGEEIEQRQKNVRDVLWGLPVVRARFEKRGLSEGKADLGDLIRAIVKELGMKSTLKEANFGRDLYEGLAVYSLRDICTEANPVPLQDKEQILEILEMCA